jgi:hypothetical protein
MECIFTDRQITLIRYSVVGAQPGQTAAMLPRRSAEQPEHVFAFVEHSLAPVAERRPAQSFDAVFEAMGSARPQISTSAGFVRTSAG